MAAGRPDRLFQVAPLKSRGKDSPNIQARQHKAKNHSKKNHSQQPAGITV
jgi:hypothetical protein